MAHITACVCQWCKAPFTARTVDVNRGWAKFCSKSCKASEQEKRTGQNRAYHAAGGKNSSEAMHDAAMESSTQGWFEGGWLEHGEK